MEIQQRLLKYINQTNWILLTLACIFSFIMFSGGVAWGVLMGGLIVTVNFQLLYRTLKKAIMTSPLTSYKSILVKYYIRFAVSGVIIFALMIKQSVNPVGLIAGLSIVVVSITVSTLFELKKTVPKEAA